MNDERKTALLFARCDRTLQSAVQELARDTGANVSVVMRGAILDYLRKHRRWPPRTDQALQGERT